MRPHFTIRYWLLAIIAVEYVYDSSRIFVLICSCKAHMFAESKGVLKKRDKQQQLKLLIHYSQHKKIFPPNVALISENFIKYSKNSIT